MNKEVETAKKIITEEIEKRNIKVEKIILFGSRARSDFNKDSDWDFYVIVDKDIAYSEKWKIIAMIQKNLAWLEIPNDIIINSINQVELRKNDVGRISYYALKEGAEI
ncbi:MAG: nucleotidyltransferase domain-containing protein [Elusimicrobiota bacterium]